MRPIRPIRPIAGKPRERRVVAAHSDVRTGADSRQFLAVSEHSAADCFFLDAGQFGVGVCDSDEVHDVEHSRTIGNLTANVNGFLTDSREALCRLTYRPMLQEILERINKRLEVVGISAAAASAKAGLSKDAIRNIQRAVEQGKEGGASTQTILKLAPVLKTSGSWLLEGIGAEDDDLGVPLMGRVGAGAEIEPDYEQVPPEGLDRVHVPFPIPDEMVAFQVVGESQYPVYKDGSIIVVYREQKRPVEAFYGLEAAVRTTDGRRFIKTITRGASGVTLTSWNAPPIENVHLAWIGEIFAVLPPSAKKLAVKGGGIQGKLPLPSEVL